MDIERIDGRFKTVVRTREPIRLLRGERTWSSLKPGEIVIVELNFPHPLLLRVGEGKAVERDPQQPGTIRCVDVVKVGSVIFDKSHVAVTGEAINEPGNPWSGKIRFVPD